MAEDTFNPDHHAGFEELYDGEILRYTHPDFPEAHIGFSTVNTPSVNGLDSHAVLEKLCPGNGAELAATMIKTGSAHGARVDTVADAAYQCPEKPSDRADGYVISLPERAAVIPVADCLAITILARKKDATADPMLGALHAGYGRERRLQSCKPSRIALTSHPKIYMCSLGRSAPSMPTTSMSKMQCRKVST